MLYILMNDKLLFLKQTCSRLQCECRSHLESCSRLSRDRAEVSSELRAQLEAVEVREASLEEKRKALTQVAF